MIVASVDALRSAAYATFVARHAHLDAATLMLSAIFATPADYAACSTLI